MCRGRHCLTQQTLSHPADSLSARSDIVSPGRQPLCPDRHCLTRHTASLPGQTLSDPADSLSGRADNVWPGRHCLTQHTASLAGQAHPAKTRQIVRCLGMLTHARSYLNPPSGIPEGSIDSIDRGSPRARSTRSIGDPLGLDRGSPRARSTRSIGDPLGLDRLDRLDRSGIP